MHQASSSLMKLMPLESNSALSKIASRRGYPQIHQVRLNFRRRARTMLELLNQLGFDTRGDVKVIMATNRVDVTRGQSSAPTIKSGLFFRGAMHQPRTRRWNIRSRTRSVNTNCDRQLEQILPHDIQVNLSCNSPRSGGGYFLFICYRVIYRQEQRRKVKHKERAAAYWDKLSHVATFAIAKRSRTRRGPRTYHPAGPAF
jgi:hypothetical protein